MNLITFLGDSVLVRLFPNQTVRLCDILSVYDKMLKPVCHPPSAPSSAAALLPERISVWEFSSRKLPLRLGLPQFLLLLIFSSSSSFVSLYQHHSFGLWRKQRITSCPFYVFFFPLGCVSFFFLFIPDEAQWVSFHAAHQKLHLALIKGSKCFCIDFFFQQTWFIIWAFKVVYVTLSEERNWP